MPRRPGGHGLDDGFAVNDERTAAAERGTGDIVKFEVTAQVSTPAGVTYVEHCGIPHYVLRRLLAED